MSEFSDKIKEFIKDTSWIFAKTYAKNWPHEYIVQERVDNELFLKLASHIDKYGYQSKFYHLTMTYFDFDGYTYWHMENIINRCLEKDTYRSREKEGRLPK